MSWMHRRIVIGFDREYLRVHTFTYKIQIVATAKRETRSSVQVSMTSNISSQLVMEDDRLFAPVDHASPAAPSRSALDSLVQAILNEKNAPDVLPYRADLVDELQREAAKQVRRGGHWTRILSCRHAGCRRRQRRRQGPLPMANMAYAYDRWEQADKHGPQ